MQNVLTLQPTVFSNTSSSHVCYSSGWNPGPAGHPLSPSLSVLSREIWSLARGFQPDRCKAPRR